MQAFKKIGYLGLLLSSCWYCISCQSPPPASESTSSPILSNFGKKLLQEQAQTENDIAHQVWLESVPKLPELFEATCFQMQTSALQAGAYQSIQPIANKTRTPYDTTITYLDLSRQNLYYIPDRIGNYTRLKYLSFRYNQIQAINPRMARCTALRRLDLSSNQLQDVPFGVVYLSQIHQLNLTDNKLTGLPNFFGGLSNLRVLDISNLHTQMASGYNNIQQLPPVLLRMPQLQKLFLDRLPLTSLPSRLYQMKRLQVVSLNGARLLNLSQAFDALSQVENLIALDLSFLGRRKLPTSIAKLQQLKILIWHENNGINTAFVAELQRLLPNCKIYYGTENTPFLRGNSIETLLEAGLKQD